MEPLDLPPREVPLAIAPANGGREHGEWRLTAAKANGGRP